MKKIIQTIQKNKTFLLAAHVNPDPDAIGSELALMYYLKSIGKKVIVLHEEKIAERFSFLPGYRSARVVPASKKVNYDVAIVLDCGDLNRIGPVKDVLVEGKPLINIDHHVTNTRFGTINYVDSKASATAEILFDLFQAAKAKLTKNMALNLYAGIMTDTGSFRFENTTAQTHQIVGELLKQGVSPTKVYSQIYETVPLGDLQNFTKLVSGFKTVKSKVVYVELTKKIMNKFSPQFDLRDAIFKFLRSAQGVEVFVIFTEIKKDVTRINFRSAGKVDVAQIASLFKGGGHKNASGGQIKKSMKVAKQLVLKEIGAVL